MLYCNKLHILSSTFIYSQLNRFRINRNKFTIGYLKLKVFSYLKTFSLFDIFELHNTTKSLTLLLLTVSMQFFYKTQFLITD
jgi:hypothetical protein